MKVRSSLKLLCKFCKFTKKGKKLRVKCLLNPRHKQRSRFSTLDQNFNLMPNEILRINSSFFPNYQQIFNDLKLNEIE